MTNSRILCCILVAWAVGPSGSFAQTFPPGPSNAAPARTSAASQTYVLTPNDVVQVKVYQEDDLETKMRIAKDGTTSFPLIGTVRLGGKTVEQAAALIRDALAKDYLVNPQVTVSVVEYSKRRFTVLGQVQKPGAYEIPNEETMTLLQAIAMAGGYTRLANRGGVTITRTVGGRKTTHTVDVKSATTDADTKPFEILADDIITIPERLF